MVFEGSVYKKNDSRQMGTVKQDKQNHFHRDAFPDALRPSFFPHHSPRPPLSFPFFPSFLPKLYRLVDRSIDSSDRTGT